MGFFDTLGKFSWNPGGIFDSKNEGENVGPNLEDLLGIVDKYTYKPQYTAQTESSLYDLFQRLTGQGGGGVEALPFDLGLPTTGLYDSLTRGIKEDYLGTPGGPESGRIADTRAYYNNLGIPEQAINEERLSNRDLNNTLTDSAARINESQKDRLTSILGLGSGIGESLYGQNLAQHRSNAGLGLNAAGLNIGVQDAIRQANQSSLNDLLGGVGAVAGTYYGGPGFGTTAGATAGRTLGDLFGGQTNISRNGNGAINPYSGSTGSGSKAKII